MDARSPLRATLVIGLLMAGLAACTTGSSPSGSTAPAASVQPSGPSPSGSALASSSPSPAPSVPASPDGSACGPSPSGCATSSPSSAACPVPTLEMALTSDRMTSIDVVPGATADVVRFRFGPPSGDTKPPVAIEPRQPPFASDPAGLPLDVAGAHVAMVRMGMGMWLYDDAGAPTYGGPARFDAPGPGVKSVVRAGAFEGYETWLVGFDAGCLTAALAPDGSLEVRVSH